ncbi:MAG: hypothetical protein ACR2GL_01595 [Thermoleophilaceae bacterium]
MEQLDPKHPSDDFFARAQQAKREEQREWFRATTPGQRVDAALNLSRLDAELWAGARSSGD